MTRDEYIQHWQRQWLLYGKSPPMVILRKHGKSRFAEEIAGESIADRATSRD